MHITHSLANWPEDAAGAVMALGNFDGMHRGHQAVIDTARAIAREQGRRLAVMTFEPHPRRFFSPDLPVLRIVSFAEKARLLRQAGVEHLYVARFNRDFSSLSAEAFIRDVLVGALQVGHVVTGHNFAFGHRRSGDTTFLAAQSSLYGYGYTRLDAVGGDSCYSSTAIRDALATGAVEQAAQILGRPYCLRGHVLHGDKRGRTIGFPTANIRPAPLYLPRDGVYAVRLRVAGQEYAAVANLGLRPTVDGARRLLEVHALDAADDMYGERAEVEFLRFVRPEMKFSGLDALQAQIAQDVENARQFHAEGNR